MMRTPNIYPRNFIDHTIRRIAVAHTRTLPPCVSTSPVASSPQVLCQPNVVSPSHGVPLVCRKETRKSSCAAQDSLRSRCVGTTFWAWLSTVPHSRKGSCRKCRSSSTFRSSRTERIPAGVKHEVGVWFEVYNMRFVRSYPLSSPLE